MTQEARPLIRFASVDPEARLGLPAGANTTPSATTVVLLTTVVSAAVYGVAYAMRERDWGGVAWEYMTGFGRIPIPIV
ncbi:MAG: hypothetical protein ACO3IB_13740, partial [Phycisphaerales bacterium]